MTPCAIITRGFVLFLIAIASVIVDPALYVALVPQGNFK